MTGKKANLVSDELARAGTDPALIDSLKKDRITTDKELPPMEFLMTLFDVPSCPRGELVAYTGKAKSGKTFVMSMLMAAAAAPKVLAFSRNTIEPLKVVWIDTEQSDQSTQDILRNRLVPMVCSPTPAPAPTEGGGFPEGLYDIFNIRIESWQERMPLVMAAIDLCRPDLVILDGIRDLVDDINDGRLAHEVTEKLLKVAQATRCCIVCVIHQNKAAEDKTLRGTIGSELTNKAFEVYECEKMMPSRTFVVTQKHTRKYDIEQPLYFTVDERGLPRQVGEAAATACEQPLQDLTTLFVRAFNGQARLSGEELRNRVMVALGMSSFKTYGNLLARAIEEDVICQWKENRRIYYSLAGPA